MLESLTELGFVAAMGCVVGNVLNDAQMSEVQALESPVVVVVVVAVRTQPAREHRGSATYFGVDIHEVYDWLGDGISDIRHSRNRVYLVELPVRWLGEEGGVAV